MQKSMPKAAGEDDDLTEGDSGDDLDLGPGSGEEGIEVEDDEGDNSDALSLMEASDNEDLIPLVPDGLIEHDDSDAGEKEEEWGGIGEGTVGGRKRKSLPTFASYENYAKMIGCKQLSSVIPAGSGISSSSSNESSSSSSYSSEVADIHLAIEDMK
jgi:ribosome biogenesis protein MAK21